MRTTERSVLSLSQRAAAPRNRKSSSRKSTLGKRDPSSIPVRARDIWGQARNTTVSNNDAYPTSLEDRLCERVYLIPSGGPQYQCQCFTTNEFHTVHIDG
jgi:hypothetical protein